MARVLGWVAHTASHPMVDGRRGATPGSDPHDLKSLSTPAVDVVVLRIPPRPMIGGYRLLGIESMQRVPIVNVETEAAGPLPSPGVGGGVVS